MSAKRIALLMGGQSAERDVSLKSGQAVMNALQELGHEVTAVNDINELKALAIDADADKSADVTGGNIDVVFNLLHGADGEDGRLAAWLALEQIPFTGCDYKGGTLSWHKDVAKSLVAQHGLLTPPFQVLTNPEQLIIDTAHGPWIVKPAGEGSSVGLVKVNEADNLAEAVYQTFELTDRVLVETYIKGIECTVGMVADDVLPVVSIHPAGELYDYAAKYSSTETQYKCPPDMSNSLQRKLQADARTVCEVLHIKGWSRVDFIVDDAERCWFLEVNTTPGMTASSLLPKAAKAHGWSFNHLVDEILKTGVMA